MPDISVPQNALTAKDFAIPALTILGSSFGAWLAAKFALRNYYRQQIWDRKAAAYTLIFEAIHAIERWHDKHMQAAIKERDIEPNEAAKLQREANEAEENLERCLAGHLS